MLSYFSSLPIAVLRSLDTEANIFYDRNHQLYDAALYALRPFIDSESNHIRSFIKIPFINKGNDFINLPSIFQDKSVICKEGTSRQRSGKGAIRKRFPLQKPRWEKTKPTIRHLYHETYRKPNEQLFSQ